MALAVVISCAVTLFSVAQTNDENQVVSRQSIDNPGPTEGSSYSGANAVRITIGMTTLSKYETNCLSGITFFSLIERSRTKA